MSRLEELVLVWLLTRKDGTGVRSGVARALASLTSHRWSPAEWSARLEEMLGTLASGGLLQRTARNGLVLTKEGQARALRFLGVERLPKGLDWKKLRLTFLTARALGVPAAQAPRLTRAGELRAVLARQQLEVEGRDGDALARALDALCWKQLGVEAEDRPLTLAAVRAVLLGRALQSSRELTPAQAVEQLAARAVGARRRDAEGLRLAALQSWFLPAPEEAPAPTPPRAAEEGLAAFAERVLRTARHAPSGRFGDDRVFISHVWRALGTPGLDERTFKNRLLEANQKRLLSLSRADMVELMDPADVSASEIRHLGATFHFIAL